MLQREGIRDRAIEMQSDTAPSEVKSYFLKPEELAKYREMKVEDDGKWSNSYKSHLEFQYR